MNSEKPSSASTITYYESNSNDLITSYETADMSNLHAFLLSNLFPNSRVLDIGFGSGRDLAFLRDNNFDVWGIDPAQKFVDHAKERFSDISDHFFTATLPDLDIPKELQHSFDSIILIAVWMHLPEEMYTDSIKSLCSLLKSEGKIILSYSITPRAGETERYFKDINSDLLQALFEEHGCTKISNTTNKDGLGKREITWVTEAYSYDKF
jgi:cyclopropane fatty-acyl-phospholipid synthase-like methyltransferase